MVIRAWSEDRRTIPVEGLLALTVKPDVWQWLQRTKAEPLPCFGCRHLVSKRDGAGGVTYYCGRLSGEQPWGVILGDESDEPKRLWEHCFEA